MGMELISLTWTHNRGVEPIIDSIPDTFTERIARHTAARNAWLATVTAAVEAWMSTTFPGGVIDPTRADHESILNDLDPSGALTMSETDITDEVRATLTLGAEIYVDAGSEWLRFAATEHVPETTLCVIAAGGGSWGDDPFDGFTALGHFLNLCVIAPDVATIVGFVAMGVASPTTMLRYAA